MATSKREWIPVGIPKALFEKVKELLGYTGDPSVAEYIRFAVRQRLRYDLDHLDDELSKEGMIGLRGREIKERDED